MGIENYGVDTNNFLKPEVLANRVFKPHLYEQLLHNSILEILGPFIGGRLTLDIGGNTGHQAFFQCQHSKHVYSYEPVPEVYQQLKKLEDKFDNFTAINAAVSDKDIPLSPFYVDDKRLSNSGFRDNVDGIEIKVPVVKLDNEGYENVGFIKVDVEGTEYDVLLGAEGIIDRDRPNCMVEIYEPFANDPLDSIFNFFFDKDYRCIYYDKNSKYKFVEVDDTLQGIHAVMTQHAAHDGDFLFLGRE